MHNQAETKIKIAVEEKNPTYYICTDPKKIILSASPLNSQELISDSPFWLRHIFLQNI